MVAKCRKIKEKWLINVSFLFNFLLPKHLSDSIIRAVGGPPQMARIRKKKFNIELTESEYQRLQAVEVDPGTCQTIRVRCRILLLLDEVHGDPLTTKGCAEKMGISSSTVYLTVKKYSTEGIDAVLSIDRNPAQDRARTKLDSRNEQRLYDLVDGPPPEGHKRWTMRLLEEESQRILDEPVSKDTICRALHRRKSGS
jgi:transposase